MVLTSTTNMNIPKTCALQPFTSYKLFTPTRTEVFHSLRYTFTQPFHTSVINLMVPRRPHREYYFQKRFERKSASKSVLMYHFAAVSKPSLSTTRYTESVIVVTKTRR